MKRKVLQFVGATAVIVLLSASASATIWLSVIDGTCLDEQGQPCTNMTLRFTDPVSGRSYSATTDSRGKFYHAGMEPSDYNMIVRRPGQADVELTAALGWSVLPLMVTVDLAKHSVHVGRQVLTVESVSPVFGMMSVGSENVVTNPFAREIQEDFERGVWVGAIRALKSAIHRSPNDSGLHALLGYANYGAAKQKPELADTFLKDCVEEYNAAINLKPEPRYYNNLGTAYVRVHRFEEALQQFRTAEGLLPARASLYERNIGVALVGQSYELPQTEAVAALQRASEAFTRVLNSEPQNDDVMYWKGIALVRLAAMNPDNAKYDEVAHLFQRYLELAPNGHFAKEVHGMLASIPALQHPQNQ
jgi:tetratricopeptide (TPR) repeat protein